MNFDIIHTPSETRVTLAGGLAYTAMDTFDRMAKNLFSESSPRYVFDLTAVEHIDSAGLGMLLIARQQARKTDASVVLVRPTTNVRAVLDLAQFAELFPIEA